MFEKASRLQLRFPSPQGLLTVEDLWQLPLTSTVNKANLDDIAKAINAKVQKTSQESFVPTKVTKKEDKEAELSLEIVKHIIAVKVADREKAEALVASKQKKEKILALIDQKKNEALSQASVEDLEKMLADL
jgi:hypothetical protein